MSLAEFIAPPEPEPEFIQRTETVGGREVLFRAYDSQQGALDALIERIRAGVRRIEPGDEFPLRWGSVIFRDVDGVVTAITQNFRSTSTTHKVRQVAQLLWVESAWDAVCAAVGLDGEPVEWDGLFRAQVGVLKTGAKLEMFRQVNVDPPGVWSVGPHPYAPEDLGGNFGLGDPYFCTEGYKYRPEIVPAFILPSDYRAVVSQERGIEEIYDPGGALVYRDQDA